MKPRSAQNKGKRFEKYISQEIEAEGLGRSVRTPGSGSGKIKGDLFNNLDFMIECKNQDKYDINRWVDQAKGQAEVGNFNSEKWALIFRDFRTSETSPDVYVMIDLYQFLQLLKKNQEPKMKEPDRDMKWKLVRLRDAINQVVKDLK